MGGAPTINLYLNGDRLSGDFVSIDPLTQEHLVEGLSYVVSSLRNQVHHTRLGGSR